MDSMTSTSENRAADRRIDHCVLPVADLADARDRLTRLGFTVAPEGRHPFGTHNACVYFADDTFLEPLAVGDRIAAQEAIGQGNVFVARDAAFRAGHGQEGFSALVYKTDDAEADHERFVRDGVSAGDILSFSRPVVDVSGQSGTASFRLAFAAPRGEDATFLFTCQRIGVPAVDRSALERHRNGATGIKAIMARAGDPAGARDVFARIAGEGVDGIEIETGERDPVLRLTGIVLAVADIGRTRDLFDQAGIGYSTSGDRVEVAPAPGQGFHFAFEER